MAVPIQPGPSFAAGNRKVLFEGRYAEGLSGRMYDVSPDGQHFLLVKAAPAGSSQSASQARFIIVKNWTEELKRLVPTP